MNDYKNILKDILEKAQKREPLSSLDLTKYELTKNDLLPFVSYCLSNLPESVAMELLVSLRNELVVFSEEDWKGIVSNFSTHKDAANRTLVHFLSFHTDSPIGFIAGIGLDTKSLSADFVKYYKNIKKNFYGESNGMNRSLYEKLKLNLTDLKVLKGIGTFEVY